MLSNAQTAALDLALSADYDARRWPDHFTAALTPGEGVRGATLRALTRRGLLVSEEDYRLTDAGRATAVRLRKQARALRAELHSLLFTHNYAETYSAEEQRAAEIYYDADVDRMLCGASVGPGESIEDAARRILGNLID